MSKELEAFGRIALHTEYDNDGSYDSLNFEEDCKLVDNALQRLESIDNANPSEALECLKHIKKYYIPEPCSAKTYDCLETIKQALLKAQENARSEEILQKYYQEGITLDSVRALKLRIEALEKDLEEQRELAKYYLEEQEKEIIELKQKAPEPKHYIKWEDLDFKEKGQWLEVKMGDNVYRLDWYIDGLGANVVYIYKYITNDYLAYCVCIKDNSQQFFNDLRLERVKE